MTKSGEFGDLGAMYGSVDCRDRVVLDIGADYGTTPRFFLDRGAARVVASERRPDWVKLLHELAAGEPRLKIIPPLSAENAADVLSSTAAEIVKVDCEGCEASLLDVDPDILARPRAWLIETHSDVLHDRFCDHLTRLGYVVSIVQDAPRRADGGKVARVLSAVKPRHPVRGLITGMGRSGSMWTAHALRECALLDARHESVPFQHIGKIRHIEVNSLMVWAVGSFDAFPAIDTVHLVRNGLDVVRSACERNPGTPFDRWVWEWTSKNDHMLAHVPAERRFRLEDLLGDDGGDNPLPMQALAKVFGAELRIDAWEEARRAPQNAGPGTYPRHDRWPEHMTREFWRIAGDVMERCGYRA